MFKVDRKEEGQSHVHRENEPAERSLQRITLSQRATTTDTAAKGKTKAEEALEASQLKSPEETGLTNGNRRLTAHRDRSLAFPEDLRVRGRGGPKRGGGGLLKAGYKG